MYPLFPICYDATSIAEPADESFFNEEWRCLHVPEVFFTCSECRNPLEMTTCKQSPSVAGRDWTILALSLRLAGEAL